MHRSLVLFTAFLLMLGGLSAPTAGQVPPDRDEAAAAAEEYLALAVDGDFNALYDRIHPDAQAVIPRVVALRAFEEIYGQLRPQLPTITGVELGAWTWRVTDETYQDAAQVSYSQPFIDPTTGEQRVTTTQMYLVPYEGRWRWFFGSDRIFLAEVIGRFAPPPPAQEAGDTEALLNTIVGDLDEFWRDLFAATEYSYRSPGVVVVDEGQLAQTGCGLVQPGFYAFYCPPDQTVYLDYPFLRDMEQRYGDFAAAFVVAHEWAHHAQTIGRIRREAAPDDVGEVYSLELELMADCFVGVWARDAETRGLLDLSDLAEAVALIKERLGDPEGIEPFDPRAHGDFDERIDYYVTGFRDGGLGCDVPL